MLTIHCDTSLPAVSFPRTTPCTSARDPSGSCISPLPFLVPACSRMMLHRPHQSLPNWERGTSLWEILLWVVQLGPNPILGPHRPHLLSHVPVNKAYRHSSNGSLWEKKGSFGSGSRQELSITDWYTSSALSFCVRGGIFQCGGKSYSNHSFRVLRRVSLKCQKSPIK